MVGVGEDVRHNIKKRVSWEFNITVFAAVNSSFWGVPRTGQIWGFLGLVGTVMNE